MAVMVAYCRSLSSKPAGAAALGPSFKPSAESDATQSGCFVPTTCTQRAELMAPTAFSADQSRAGGDGRLTCKITHTPVSDDRAKLGRNWDE